MAINTSSVPTMDEKMIPLSGASSPARRRSLKFAIGAWGPGGLRIGYGGDGGDGGRGGEGERGGGRGG